MMRIHCKGSARMAGSKETGWLARYRQFVTNNVEIIGNMESTLRSLSYIIPGTDFLSNFISPVRSI